MNSCDVCPQPQLWSEAMMVRSDMSGLLYRWSILSLTDLAVMLESPTAPQRDGAWPLSLLAFVATTHALRLPGQLLPRGYLFRVIS